MNGDVLQKGDQQVLINLLRPRLDRFSSDYEINIFGFLRTSYRIEITGTPMDFGYVDNLLKAIKLQVARYMRKWDFTLVVNLIERF